METSTSTHTNLSKTELDHESMCLDAIDQLRQRKARPDLVRICNMTQRRHGLSFQETETVLERLVEAGQVVKVDYKGDISYRNALKWRKSHLGGNVLNAKSTSRRIIDAIVEIRKSESCERPGASLAEIESWIAENCTVSDLTSKGLTRLDVALDREVDIGRVVRLANGNYVIGNLDARRLPTKDDKVQSPNSSFGGFESKIKRARKKKTKSFDPADIDLCANKKAKLHWKSKKKSDLDKVEKGNKMVQSAGSGESLDGEEVPKKQQHQQQQQQQQQHQQQQHPPTTKDEAQNQVTSSALGLGRLVDQKCDYCLQYSGLNPKGPPEDLLICEDCNAKAHPSCMNYSRELARRALSSPWQCIDCKTCCICTDADDAAEMLFCDACDKGYHMKCHDPPLVDKPSGKWMCFRCVLDGCELPEDEPEYMLNGASCLPTPCASPISDFNGNNTKLSSANSAPLRKPEVTMEQANSWTIDDVVKFVSDKGFPEHAEKFREQEIDGKSLLLMKRGDVLTGLSLKLGPALKIHKYVSQLQSDVMDS